MTLQRDTDRWFLQYRTRAVQGRKGGMGIGSSAKKAKALRPGTALANLRAAARKHPEVMVKIPKRHSRHSKGMKGIRHHLDYVSRNGKVTLETQSGEQISGKKAVREHLDQWRDTFGIAEETKHREALNIVLSMPAGTPPKAVLNAAREFAAEQFSGHQYAFALHHESDNPEEPPHPHVHLCVLMRDDMGRRINPRKNDLFEWRVRFAEKLRDEGVQCAATRRQHRGRTPKAQNGTVAAIDRRLAKDQAARPESSLNQSRHTAARQQTLRTALHSGQRPDNPYRGKAAATRTALIRRYKSLARQLYTQGMKTEARDIAKLAKELEQSGYDTRLQQDYDRMQAERLREAQRPNAARQPENRPTPTANTSPTQIGLDDEHDHER